MAYDSSKDKLVKEVIVPGGAFRVAIFSYNNGPEKLAVQTKNVYFNKTTGQSVDGWKNVDGRLTIPEWSVIAGVIKEISK